MGCGAADGIGSITSGCGAGCPPRPPKFRRILADRVDSSRYAAGNQVVARLGAVPAVDSAGRKAHVVGIYLQGTYRFTLADATTSAVPGYDQLAIWSNIFLEDVGGWQYFAGTVGGRQIYDEGYMRAQRGHATNLPTTIAQNAGAGTVDQQIDLYIPLSDRSYDRGPVLDGAIPLAALQAKSDAFRFTVGTPQGGTYTDVANTGFQLMNIWLDLVYVDALVIGDPWQLEEYTINDLSGSVRHGERRTLMLALRFMPEDTGGQNLTDYGQTTISVNGDTTIPPLTATELATRSSWLANDWEGMDGGARPVVGGTTLQSFYVVSGVTIPVAYLIEPARKRADACAGIVAYSFTSRSTHTTNRFLHKTAACQYPGRTEAIALAAGCTSSMVADVRGMTPCGRVAEAPTGTSPIVVVAPGGPQPGAQLLDSLPGSAVLTHR